MSIGLDDPLIPNYKLIPHTIAYLFIWSLNDSYLSFGIIGNAQWISLHLSSMRLSEVLARLRGTCIIHIITFNLDISLSLSLFGGFPFRRIGYHSVLRKRRSWRRNSRPCKPMKCDYFWPKPMPKIPQSRQNQVETFLLIPGCAAPGILPLRSGSGEPTCLHWLTTAVYYCASGAEYLAVRVAFVRLCTSFNCLAQSFP